MVNTQQITSSVIDNPFCMSCTSAITDVHLLKNTVVVPAWHACRMHMLLGGVLILPDRCSMSPVMCTAGHGLLRVAYVPWL